MSKCTQKEKQQRGQKGEGEFRDSINDLKAWVKKMENAGYGTPFDYLVLMDNHNFAVEVKVRDAPTIGYNDRSITPNEKKGLTAFEQKLERNTSYIIAIWKNENKKRAFLIPWGLVRDDVCSGRRGSIRMTDYFEVPRKKLSTGKWGWDLSLFMD